VNPDQELTATITRSNRWLKSKLVALGSAAVWAVYAAGVARTQAAAQRFSEEGDERRTARSGARPTAAAVAPSEPVVASLQTPVADTTRTQAPAKVAATPSTKPKPRQASTPAPAVADTTVAPAKSTDTLVVPVVAAVPVTPPPASQTAAAHADSAAQQADKDHPHYRDGTYTGWGTSRHGDIQASVDIKDGRIVDAYVSICMTQYSCSWIAALPSQVVARQSADVDFVSGATQSTNAFYYAVVEALKKAK
jgi:uncharacterized protein with FMN-binding domain